MKNPSAVRMARFRVGPLCFEHSVLGLARQLAVVPGVRRVDLDIPAGLANIEFDADTMTPQRLERAISDCGYDCGCVSDAKG
jgi:copper chaperone CopZ